MSGSVLDGIQLVTLADSVYIRRPYVTSCVRSWRRIHGTESPWWVIDAGLKHEDGSRLEELGLALPPDAAVRLEDALGPWPALRDMRNRFITWRKLVDAVALFGHAQHVLFIDTDAFIARPMAFPKTSFHCAYQCDDVPAYRGSWYLPLCEPMVVSLNAGFMLFRPSLIDLAELERLTQRYFVHSKKMWWTVQAVWSVVMAASNASAVFDGHDVRTFSGNRKRTLQDIQRNRVKLTGRNARIRSEEEAAALMHGAAVIHFAGHGKAWFQLAESLSDDQAPVHVIGMRPAPVANPWQRTAIAARMLAVQLLK